MLFSSLEFLILFLPLTLAVALRLRGQPLLRWIAFTSVVFYAFAGHWWFIVPMLVTTVVDYWVAIVIERTQAPARRRALLAISLAGNLGLLAYFKYAGLLARTVEAGVAALGVPSMLHVTRWFDVILPAGISFYTFQTLSYIIDVWRGAAPAERNFVRFAGFVSFFPHLVAGPLTRHHQLIPQLTRIATTGISPRWRAGILLFCVGLCKKVLLADRLGNLVDPLLAPPMELDALRAWLALAGYALQIYFDFSGYSDMAIGLGRLFGIELPQNFNSPYKAASPSDFWRRWHMPLSAGCATISTSRSAAIALAGAAARQSHDDDDPRRPLARRQLDVRRLGRGTASCWCSTGPTPSAGSACRSRGAQRDVPPDDPGMGVLRAETFDRPRTGSRPSPTRRWRAPGPGRGRALSAGRARHPHHAAGSQQPRAAAGAAAGPAPGRLAAATAMALVLMNYSSKFLYFQF